MTSAKRRIRVRRWAVVVVATACVLLTGCSTQVSGAVAPVTGSPGGTIVDDAAITTASNTTAAAPSVGSAPDSSAATSSGPAGWSAEVVPLGSVGMVSPTGELTAQVIGDRVCFAPAGAVGSCAALAPGDSPTLALFSPDGEYLLVVAGHPPDIGAYVLATEDASVRVLGTDGVRDFTTGSAPPRWDLSSAAWGASGSSVLLLPMTDQSAGDLIEFDLTSGGVGRSVELPAELANSSPSLWAAAGGIAVVPNIGALRHTLWWADTEGGGVRKLTEVAEPEASLLLSAVDPTGRIVLVCPRSAAGFLGATVGVVVDIAQTSPLLKNSDSCAGAVFSADGRYLATTAEVAGDHLLTIVDRASGESVLVSSLDFPAAPKVPPLLTWHGDTIVATALSGDSATPTVLVRLTR